MPTCHQHSRLMFNNYYQTLHLAKLIPSSYDMVIFAKLVLFDISKKLSIVSPNPNAEHVNQDQLVQNQGFPTTAMLVSFLSIIKTYFRNAKIQYS